MLVDTTGFVKAFFPEEAFELICQQTNLYSLQFFDQPADFLAHCQKMKLRTTGHHTGLYTLLLQK